MTVNILFADRQLRWDQYETHLRTAFDEIGLDFDLRTDFAPAEVDYIIYAPSSPVQDFTPYTRLKAVLNLWAGVETAVGNPTLKVPFARMVDGDGLTQGMVEWVTGHTLRHHLGMDAHIVNHGHVWKNVPPPLSRERPVTILGLGALGVACANALIGLGFDITGWSRSAKDLPGITCHHGDDGLTTALSGAQIVILLLPDTAATTDILNARTLNLLARGAFVINPGRGPLIDDTALIDALNAGQIAQATLDVFRTEPCPPITPIGRIPVLPSPRHIAADTRPDSAARVIAQNICRSEAGEPMLHLVDRAAGY